MKKFHAAAQRRDDNSCFTATLSWRRCAAAGVLLLLAFNALAQTTDPNDIVAQRSQLRGYLETGRYTELETTAKRILQKSPDAGAIRHELAEALAATGRYTEAV